MKLQKLDQIELKEQNQKTLLNGNLLKKSQKINKK